MKNIIQIFFLAIITTSCKSPVQVEMTPIYFFQIYSEEDSKIARSLGREFGKMEELKNENITNDSSAYMWAWNITEDIRNNGSTQEEKDLFSNVNEFKLYDENGIDITNRVSFEGIENYPNPIN